MIIYKWWNFSIPIILLLLQDGICDVNMIQKSNVLNTRHENEYVDPHSFYYNKHTKTQMRIYERRSGNSHSDTGLIQFSQHQECNRIFNDCVNDKIKDIPDELFSRRIINMLMSVASFERIEDSLIGNIVIQVTPSQLKKLKNFGLGETTIRDIDSMIPNIFKAPEKYLFQDTFSFIKYLCIEAFMHKDILIGSLVVLFMIWIILTTKWNMMKLFSITIMIVLAASFVITWLQLLKEAEIKHTVKQMLFTDLPSHCQPNKMTWVDKIWMMFSSLDSCHTHYEAMMENPFLHVTPAQALFHMITTCIVHPAKSLGDALGEFAHHCTKHLPYPVRVLLEPLMMVGIIVLTILAIICLAGGSIGWGLGPLTLFSLRGSDRPANSKSINNTERREPIQVILNVKVSQGGGTPQLAIETPKQEDNATVTLVEDSGSSGEPVTDPAEEVNSGQSFVSRVSLLTKYRKSEPKIPESEALHVNPASGDSCLLNRPSVYDKSERTHESKIGEIVAESGSGDN